MRICLYTETALPKIGGQEIVVDALARRFLARGHDVTVLAPYPRQRMQLEDASYPYRMLRHPRFYSRRFLVSWYRWWLLRLHARWPIDVLHCHGIYPAGYLAALLGDRLRCPVLITSHGTDVFAADRRLNKPVIGRRTAQALAAADTLVSISSFTRCGFSRLSPEADSKIADIPNGVDLRPYAAPVPRPAELDPRIRPGYLLFLGRLHPRKGVDLLLHALGRLPEQTQLVVAGAGAERTELEGLCNRLGLTERVVFVGAVHHPLKTYLLQNARCTVIPSRLWEAFGLVVLESFAAGTPVIASDAPGLRDLIQPGRTGWLSPVEDIAALADVLREAMAARPESLRASCLEVAQAHGWDSIADRHVELYERLREARQRRVAASPQRPLADAA